MGTQVAFQNSNNASMAFQRLRYSDDPTRWDAFVRSHEKGSVFHLSGLLTAFKVTKKHEVHASAAVADDGRIVALVPAVRVATFGGLASLVSSRSIYYAEPICEDSTVGRAALRQLIRQHDQETRHRSLFAEVRNIMQPGAERAELEACGYEFTEYLNYVVDTSLDSEALWRRLGKSARNTITRSKRRGVEVVCESTHDGIRRMYSLVRASYERSSVPLADVSLFHEALDRLPDASVQVRMAIYENQDVAAGISLLFGGRFYAWYGGSLRLPSISPFDCLTWDEIRWCSENGMDCYDFGGAGWPNEEYGPRKFKAKFRGELVNYGRYRKVYRQLTLPLAKSTYDLVRRIIPF